MPKLNKLVANIMPYISQVAKMYTTFLSKLQCVRQSYSMHRAPPLPTLVNLLAQSARLYAQFGDSNQLLKCVVFMAFILRFLYRLDYLKLTMRIIHS